LETWNLDHAALELTVGNITHLNCDAIVNAANSSLLGGGGVDGAIHSAGGPRILDECRAIVARIGRLPAGEAVTTGAGLLQSRFVIHTVGPVYNDGEHGEEQTLANCYKSSLSEAEQHDVRSIAFPAISTGVYRYPPDEAAMVAVSAVIEYFDEHPDSGVSRVIFVAYNEAAAEIYRNVLDENV